jgi:hypothetical protein
MVIIGGRVHSYVDIILDTTQLAGGNGAGKTSTINALQFLYLVDEKKWSFLEGQKSLGTKDFYFPPGNVAFAATIFEVRTPVGVKMVIVRRPSGLLPDLSYIVASGAYERNDFMNERGQPRKWDEVRLRLSSLGELHDITDKRQLCLTGRIVDSTLPNLSLIPLVNSDNGSYEKFSVSFLNLLRLKDMDQAMLQTTLMDFAGISERQRVVDLQASLTEEIEHIRRDVGKIERLTSFANVVEEARSTYERMLTNGKWLGEAYPKFLEMRRNYDIDHPVRVRAAMAVVAAAKEESALVKTAQSDLDQQRNPLIVTKGRLESALAQLKADEASFVDFNRAHANASMEEAQKEARAIRGRIAKATDRSVPELQAELAQFDADLARLSANVESHSQLLVTWLRERMPVAELNKIYAILSPEHFSAVVGKDVNILSETALLEELRGLAGHVKGDRLLTPGISLSLDLKSATDGVKQLADVAALRAKIVTTSERRARCAKLLEDAEREFMLETQAGRLEAGAETIKKQIAQFDAMLNNQLEQPKWLEALQDTQNRLSAIDADRDVLFERAATAGLRKRDADERLKALGDEKIGIAKRAVSIRPADAVVEIPEYQQAVAETELLPLIDAYERTYAAYEKDRRAWDSVRANVEHNLSDLFPSASTPRLMLKHLTDEISALPLRREHTNKRMQTALTSASSQFQGLLGALNSLTKKVKVIQRELSRVKISGIESVRCEVERNKTECTRLMGLADLDSGFDFFNDRKTVEEQIVRILGNDVYRLSDYFSVRLFIKPIGQQERSYSEFSESTGSTGQVVTLKMLFNFLIIRSYLKEGAAVVPFFLDEVGKLDAKNFANVIEFSKALGFEGIYAAPLPAPGVNRYYNITTTSADKLVVSSERCQVISAKAAVA